MRAVTTYNEYQKNQRARECLRSVQTSTERKEKNNFSSSLVSCAGNSLRFFIFGPLWTYITIDRWENKDRDVKRICSLISTFMEWSSLGIIAVYSVKVANFGIKYNLIVWTRTPRVEVLKFVTSIWGIHSVKIIKTSNLVIYATEIIFSDHMTRQLS